MKVDRNDLLAALKSAASVIERTHVDVLDGIYLVAADGRLSVRARSFERAIAVDVSCDGDLQPVVAKHLKLIAAIEGAVGGSLSIEPDGDGIKIVTANRGKRRLPTIPSDQFPVTPEKPVLLTLKADLTELREALSAADPAVCADETQYHLHGVYAHPHGDIARLVATNLKVANVATCRIEGLTDGLTLPRSLVRTLARVSQDGEVVIERSESGFIARWGATEFWCRALEGAFPANYQSFIPTNGHRLDVQGSELLRACRSAAGVSDATGERRVNVVTLELSRDGCAASVACHDTQAEEPIDGEWSGLEPTRIGVAVQDVATVCATVGTGPIRLYVPDEKKSVRVEGPDGRLGLISLFAL